MRVSQRLDYGLRALILLAQQPEGDFIAAGDLADRLGMPRRFVEQQFTALARAGIVDCRRGSTGGCALARPAAEISVAEIATALQGEVLDVPHQNGSASAEFWEQMAQDMADLLGRTNLEELAIRQRALESDMFPMYYI